MEFFDCLRTGSGSSSFEVLVSHGGGKYVSVSSLCHRSIGRCFGVHLDDVRSVCRGPNGILMVLPYYSCVWLCL